jgi:predicted ATPase
MKKNQIKSLRIQNLLSFGHDSPGVELGHLNVLIGPNSSGKSNFIEVLGLLRSTPKDFASEVGDSGGLSELIWKGKSKAKSTTARVEVVAALAGVTRAVRYQLAFARAGAFLKIVDERIESENPSEANGQPYFAYNGGRPLLKVARQQRRLQPEDVDPQQSILSQRQDSDQYPEVTSLGKFFRSFRLYRNWSFGPDSDVRDLYGAEQKSDFLEEDISNLGLMLHNIRTGAKAEFVKYLKILYQGAEDISTPITGGLIDLRVEEANNVSIPALRLSDGTLRWLSLLTILLHPDPPPLVCIEEPELGLHPDVIKPLAKLLLSASERMQLVVTTHSDDLVDELSGIPDAVIVCEKYDGSSSLKRLDGERLAKWLKRYSLGELWRTGEIGGNRW